MTPRQAAAWARLGFARRREEAAEALHIAWTAARGAPEAANQQLREWNDAT